MAEEMLDGRIKAGSQVEVVFDGEKLTFTVKEKAARTRAKAALKPAAAKDGSEDKSKAVRGKGGAGRASGRKKDTAAPKA